MIAIKNKMVFETNLKIIKKRAEVEKEMAKMNGTYTEVDERLEGVFGDKEFMKAVLNCESPDKAYELFCTRNSDLTKDQFVELIKASFQMYETLASKDEELSEDELEQIAGGGFFGTAWKVIKTVGYSALTPFSVIGDLASNIPTFGAWGFSGTRELVNCISDTWKD